MKRLNVINRKFPEEYHVSYTIETIEKVIHGKYKDYFSKEDISGNQCRPNDSVIILKFKDGTEASFNDEWEITFE